MRTLVKIDSRSPDSGYVFVPGGSFTHVERRVLKHLGHIAKVEIELTALGAFPRTVHHKVASWLAPDDTTNVCSDGSVLIRYSQETVQ